MSALTRPRAWRRGNAVQKGKKYDPKTGGAVIEVIKSGKVRVLWVNSNDDGDRAWMRLERPETLRRATREQRELVAMYLVLEQAVHAGYLKRVPA